MDKVHNAKYKRKSGLDEGTTMSSAIPKKTGRNEASGPAQMPKSNPKEKDGPFTLC